MKTYTLIALITGAAWAAQGQTVFLKATSQGNKQSDKTTTDGSGKSNFKRTLHTFRQETVEISVRNTFAGSVDYLIEWMFLSSPAKGGDPVPCAVDEKTVTLAVNGTSTFQVTSPKLEAMQTFQHSFESTRLMDGGREQRERVRSLGFEGSKPAGFVVRVKANGKIIAVDASDSALERRYQSPVAPWTPPELPKEKEDPRDKSVPKKKPLKK